MARGVIPAPQPTLPKHFDDAKLVAMIEPLTVRIEKLRGHVRMPIPMPPPADNPELPGGTGYDQAAVRGLENWLVTEWAGGGKYEFTITDSNSPASVMKWTSEWDEKIYPALIPPPLQGIAQPAAQPPPLAVLPYPPPGSRQHQAQQAQMSAFPQGLPSGGIPAFAQAPAQPQPYYQQPPLPPPPMPGSYAWPHWQQESERREREARERERDAELKAMREREERHAREVMEAKHKADLERERQASEQRFVALQQQLTEMRNALVAAQQAPKESAEIQLLREQNRQNAERLERERAEREAERRENGLREAIRQMQEQTQRQIDTLARQFDDRTRAIELASQNNNKPDQLLMMWKESSRESAEAMKELARNQTQQMQTFQSFMMRPENILAMARESTSSVDQATDRVTNFFGKVIETQQKVTENLLQMQPSSSGVTEVVGNGIDRLGSAIERYIGGKQMETQIQHQANVEIARAQAIAYAEAARAQAGLSGQPTQQAQAQPQTQAPAEQPHAPHTNGVATATPEQPAQSASTKRRLGRTDQEWFGVILPQVEQLRDEAGKFIESLKLKRTDKRGQPIGLAPDAAVDAIVQAIGICMQRQIPIPAMMDLLFQHRHADFVDVLLPDVPQTYRDDVTQGILTVERKLQGQTADINNPIEGTDQIVAQQNAAHEDDDDDGDDDDDDDDDDDPDVKDGDTIKPIKSTPPTRIRA